MAARKRLTKIATPKASRPHMPGYSLPSGKKGLLPWKWAEQRLNESHNYWITTSRPNGSPHTMVIWGLWWNGSFCFSTGSQSRKTRNLENNPNCVICNEDADEAVIVEGISRRMREVPRIREFLKLYEKKYKFDMSGFEKEILALKEPVFVVQPKVIFGLDEKQSLNAATRWKFNN